MLPLNDLVIVAIVFIVTFVAIRWFKKQRGINVEEFLKGVYEQLLDAAVIDPGTTFKEFKEKTQDMVTVRENEDGEIEYEFSGNIPKEIVNKTLISEDASPTTDLIHEDFEGYVNGMEFPHAVRDSTTGDVFTNLSINKSYNDAQEEVIKFQKRHNAASERPVSVKYHILPIYDKTVHEEIPEDSVWASYVLKVDAEEN